MSKPGKRLEWQIIHFTIVWGLNRFLSLHFVSNLCLQVPIGLLPAFLVSVLLIPSADSVPSLSIRYTVSFTSPNWHFRPGFSSSLAISCCFKGWLTILPRVRPLYPSLNCSFSLLLFAIIPSTLPLIFDGSLVFLYMDCRSSLSLRPQFLTLI